MAWTGVPEIGLGPSLLLRANRDLNRWRDDLPIEDLHAQVLSLVPAQFLQTPLERREAGLPLRRVSGAVKSRPIRGDGADCCARAVSGEAVTVTPSIATKSRRLIRPPPCLCGGNLAALN
jgi:hypothetical protein